MRASGYARVANDWYVESPESVLALLNKEPIGTASMCLDPCCGAGNIPRVLRAQGITCLGSDIVDRGYGSVGDFFEREPGCGVNVVISNPPYGVMERFIEHALRVADDRVIILGRLALLEGQSRGALFDRTPLARVWVSRKRISMPPGGGEVKAGGGSVAFAWFVWQHGWFGPPQLGWV